MHQRQATQMRVVSFYEDAESTMNKVNDCDEIFYAKVGQTHVYRRTRSGGGGKRMVGGNGEGDTFAGRNILRIMNTVLSKRMNMKWAWRSPNGIPTDGIHHLD